MDFDQWKPLTGRGDPLRNDPTYDYEPPVLERVHYWADETRLEREHYPERKSEILMLGVSSRKPSVGSRPPPPPRRHHRPSPPKYEDYSYKLSDHYPMTILVPPPPPPPGHKPSLFILEDQLSPQPTSQIKITDPPKLVKPTTAAPEHLTSLYALQEANLIYQSSTTSQSWIYNPNRTNTLPNQAVSSDYAGWGPTTPLDDNEIINDSHNLISNEPYSFYKPMLSEAPPPPRVTKNPLLLPTFIPTALPPLQPMVPSTTSSVKQQTWLTEPTTTTAPIFTIDYNEQTTADNDFTTMLYQSNTVSDSQTNPGETVLDMLTPMMTMPMVQPEHFEDNLYAHASENHHIFKETKPEDIAQLETMQPPPVTKQSESSKPHKELFRVNLQTHKLAHKKPSTHTHDPYLHMRFTTPMPTIASSVDTTENTKSTTEAPTVATYLIIQGHSKVKTYSSKIKSTDNNDTINNEIPKPNETNEVKHLHPIKDKYLQKPDKSDRIRHSRAQDLKSLVDEGRGSIEIQEADIGIKYDVSDGSDVPVEIYRKGIVDNDVNKYSKNKGEKKKRVKRQTGRGLSDLLPDEDTVEEYVYNFLKRKRNETGITGLIAKVVTGKTGAVLDDLDDDDDEDEEDDNEYR